MLFFKPKQKSQELLPPPPPEEPENIEIKEFEGSHAEELQQGLLEKPALFDKTLTPEEEKEDEIPEEEEFSSFVKNLKPSKSEKLRQKALPKKIQKLSKKRTRAKTESIKNIIEEDTKTAPEIGDFGAEHESAELPETLEEFDIKTDFEAQNTDFENQLKFSKNENPQEIVEAQQEIKSAIEKIKEKEKPSFFKKLFAKQKKPEERITLQKIAEIPEVNKVSAIQSQIKNARNSLMKFDLETAKQSYIEIMKAYREITPEYQARVYKAIRELYFERKSAEELKV